jgi:membrane protein
MTDSPTDLSTPSWRAVLRRSLAGIQDDNLTDLAAALTYYGVLAIFPGLLVVVSLLGLLGPSATRSLKDNVGQVAPQGVFTFVNTIIDNAQKQQAGAGLAAVVGLVLALWSASGYIAAFMRAANTIYGIGEGRPIWKTIPVRVLVTLAVMVLLVISAGIVLVTGQIADQVGRAVGIGNTAVTAWNIAKWPVLLVIVALVLALLYWACPNVKHAGFRWVSPGSALAVVIWLVASAAFAVYIGNFASYNKTYGSVAGVIIFLVWLWISNLAVLLGAEFDAELQHQRAIAEGLPADLEPFVQPRDTRKLDAEETRKAEALAEHREG